MALKTNSKEVKQAIRNYLVENVTALLDERGIETDKPFTAYFEIVKTEKSYGKLHYYSDFQMFDDWLRGLGGFGDDIFYTWDNNGFTRCKNTLASWLHETPEEMDKYSETQSEDLMCKLCWREFCFLMDKEK